MTPVTSADSKWVHFYTDGPATLCGRPIDLNRWTVRAREHVHDDKWCATCWTRAHEQPPPTPSTKAVKARAQAGNQHRDGDGRFTTAGDAT